MLPIPLEQYDPVTIKIANILLLAGEFNRKDLDVICGGKRKAARYLYQHKRMFKLVRKQYKRTVQRYIRPILSRKEETHFSLLLDALGEDGAAKKYYIENVWENGKLQTNESSSYRNASIAHSAMLFYDHFDVLAWKRKSLRDTYSEEAPIPLNTFYPASEIKWFAEAGESFEYRNSMSTGTLVCDNGTFVMYALKQRPRNKIAWKAGTEERYLMQVENVFKAVKCPEINKSADKLIILGKERVAASICEAMLSSEDKDVGLKLPESVDKVIFLPDEDPSGQEIVDILSIPDYQSRIRDYYIPEKYRQLANSKTEDGYTDDLVFDENGKEIKDENGNSITEEKEVLLLFDNDLSRLCAALNKTTRKINKLMIYCLDSQYELINGIRILFENLREKERNRESDNTQEIIYGYDDVTISILTESFEDLMENIRKEEEENVS